MRKLLLLVPLALLTALSACQRQEEAAPPPQAQAAPSFVSQAGFDAAGYYQPESPVQFGNFKLTNIALGAPSDFTAWQEGRREGVFGPIWFEFEDVASPLQTNELGAQVHQVRARVVPDSYLMQPGKFEFTGAHPELGEVNFKGVIDAAALATAKAEHNTQMVVLTGDLTVGAQTVSGAAFSFFAGD